jgi:hypothetical protein
VIPTSKIKINAEELAILFDYGVRSNGSGGFQYLTRLLCALVNKATGELDLTDKQLGRCVRYMINYGRGGFQDSFLRPVFRRVLKL